ncbi:MAG: MerR family transcriptional regulator [Candidatus Rokubacteria bacterium]|nr:MerR family transcriptional regulator [Candidatus Rokubacteria bacterium]
MRIRELARQLGCSPEWLKRLERTGSIPPASRDLRGHRRYGPEDVERIRAILFSSDRDNGGHRVGQRAEAGRVE